MNEDRKKTVSWALPLWYFAIFCIGFFAYGGLQGGLALFLLTFVSNLLVFLGLIPFIGFALCLVLSRFVVYPYMFEFLGITATIWTSAIFWFGGIIAILLTILTTIALLGGAF